MTELGQPITTKVKMQEAIIVSLKVKQEESQREIDLLKRQLDDSTKIALTSSQMDHMLDKIEESFEEYDLSDTRRWEFEFDIDYDNRIAVNSMHMDNSSDFAEDIWTRVCSLFKEIK